jgi:hypothetical protein
MEWRLTATIHYDNGGRIPASQRSRKSFTGVCAKVLVSNAASRKFSPFARGILGRTLGNPLWFETVPRTSTGASTLRKLWRSTDLEKNQKMRVRNGTIRGLGGKRR